MNQKLAMSLLVAGILACAASPQQQQDVPLVVSMIELIANPEKYDAKTVLVTGFLRIEHEGDILYFSENDFVHGISKNGLWVERTPDIVRELEKLDSAYVIVVGTFNPRAKGHRSSTSGSIQRIRTCTFWSNGKDPISRRWK